MAKTTEELMNNKWWDGVEETDMPKYFWFAKERVYKVDYWDLHDPNGVCAWSNHLGFYPHQEDILPATESDYLQSQQNK